MYALQAARPEMIRTGDDSNGRASIPPMCLNRDYSEEASITFTPVSTFSSASASPASAFAADIMPS